MDRVKPIQWPGHRIALVKLKGISGLGFNVYSHHFKSRVMVAHSSSTSTTEQIQEPRLVHLRLIQSGPLRNTKRPNHTNPRITPAFTGTRRPSTG